MSKIISLKGTPTTILHSVKYFCELLPFQVSQLGLMDSYGSGLEGQEK